MDRNSPATSGISGWGGGKASDAPASARPTPEPEKTKRATAGRGKAAMIPAHISRAANSTQPAMPSKTTSPPAPQSKTFGGITLTPAPGKSAPTKKPPAQKKSSVNPADPWEQAGYRQPPAPKTIEAPARVPGGRGRPVAAWKNEENNQSPPSTARTLGGRGKPIAAWQEQAEKDAPPTVEDPWEQAERDDPWEKAQRDDPWEKAQRDDPWEKAQREDPWEQKKGDPEEDWKRDVEPDSPKKPRRSKYVNQDAPPPYAPSEEPTYGSGKARVTTPPKKMSSWESAAAEWGKPNTRNRVDSQPITLEKDKFDDDKPSRSIDRAAAGRLIKAGVNNKEWDRSNAAAAGTTLAKHREEVANNLSQPTSIPVKKDSTHASTYDKLSSTTRSKIDMSLDEKPARKSKEQYDADDEEEQYTPEEIAAWEAKQAAWKKKKSQEWQEDGWEIKKQASWKKEDESWEVKKETSWKKDGILEQPAQNRYTFQMFVVNQSNHH